MAYLTTLGLNLPPILLTGAVALIGLLLFGLLGRFVFGKKSNLTYSLSSVIGILFLWALTVVLRHFLPQYASALAPIPFIQIGTETLSFFDFYSADYTAICSEVLSMIILSFLFNTVDRWMPKPKNVFGWLFFRCLTVIAALLLHIFVSALVYRYVPHGLITYAPVVLLALLVLMLLTGALKLLVGIVLSTVNPLIGALYTFFFASIVGKMITRAVMTTAILALMIIALKYIGVAFIGIAVSALVFYIPLLILLAAMWYIINRTF